MTFIGPVPPHRGGVAQYSIRLIHGLRERDTDVEVVTWRSMYPKALYPGKDLRVNQPVVGRPLLSWWNPLSWVRAGLIARRRDLTVVPWVTPFHSLALRVVQAVSGRPLTVIVHNVRPHEPFPMSEGLTKWGLRPATRFVVHSASVAAELAELNLRQPVRVVPHPPNIDVSKEPLPAFPPYRFLCLGYVRPYKGVDLAISGLALARSQGWDAVLTVAGEVWDQGSELRELVEHLGLGEHVRFDTRYIPDELVSSLIAEHHVLVATYRSASQSGVVPLALSAGRPVVATPVGGLPGAVRNGQSGVIATSVTEESIARAMVGCMSNLISLANGAARVDLSWDQVVMAIAGDK